MIEEKVKQQSLKRNTLIYGLGNLSIFAIKFFLVPLYTFYLSEGDLGWFDVMASTVPMIAVVLGGHTELALLRWMLEKPSLPIQKQVFTNSIFLNLIGILVFSLSYYWITVLQLFDFSEFTSPIYLYFYILAVWFYTFLKQSVRSIYSAKMFVVTDVAFTLTFLLQVICFVIILGMQINGILLAFSLSSLLTGLYWMLFRKMVLYIDVRSLSFHFTKELLRYSLPLVPNTFNLWSINTIVKYIILLLLGIVSNGIFAIAFKIGFVIQMLNSIFNYAWQDKAISSYMKEGFKDQVNSIFQKYFVLFSCMTLCLIAGQSVIVDMFIDGNFHEAKNYIWLIAFGFFFTGLANFIGVIYQCEKQTMQITISSVVANVVLLLSAGFLTFRYALYGASIAFLLANATMFLYRLYHVKRFIRLSLNLTYLLAFLIASTAVLLATFYSVSLAIGLAFVFAIGSNFSELEKLSIRFKKLFN
jgi:O-antigen/teichoic acid export membrane protein